MGALAGVGHGDSMHQMRRCGCGMEPPWLAEELRGMGGAEGEGERLGQGPGVVMPTASSSGLGCWLLPYFRSFQVIPGPAGSPACCRPPEVTQTRVT